MQDCSVVLVPSSSIMRICCLPMKVVKLSEKTFPVLLSVMNKVKTTECGSDVEETDTSKRVVL